MRLDGFAQLAFEVLALKLFFEFAEGRFDRDAFRENINIRFDRDGSHGAISTVVNMIDGGGKNLGFQSPGNLRRRFRVRAPFHLQFKMMWRNSPVSLLSSDARIDHMIHAQNYLIRAQAA